MLTHCMVHLRQEASDRLLPGPIAASAPSDTGTPMVSHLPAANRMLISVGGADPHLAALEHLLERVPGCPLSRLAWTARANGALHSHLVDRLCHILYRGLYAHVAIRRPPGYHRGKHGTPLNTHWRFAGSSSPGTRCPDPPGGVFLPHTGAVMVRRSLPSRPPHRSTPPRR